MEQSKKQRYEILVQVTRVLVEDIVAEDKTEAKKLAKQSAQFQGFNEYEYDVDVINVREVK